ncbi:helix-turn-helix transcriptional regulator [Microbacterium sp. SL75]|uniref:helix-turn-helix transcriptional regulator n=1 Tax=Microbacterium sp. SL75 TaxID=2995140 RepID=UPI00226F297A|nr:helix-turn-helix domain-containing protein [Microbacterium sp. SL75]WAC68546.1 helix-turn-helix domain-containing protein [Microbacterium sp. SL75]
MTVTDLNNTSRLLTPREVAAWLGRSVPALSQMRYRGTGPRFIRAGGRVRYRVCDVEAWLTAGERSAT